MRIGTIDLLVIVGYMLATVVLGLWIGRRHRAGATTQDYFLGNRQLPWYALLLSIVATETSTATFLSVPGKTFAVGGNLGFLQLALGLVVGRIIVAWLLVPMYFRGELQTAYELLEQRLGVSTRRLASVLFLVTRTVGDALRLYLAALVLRNVVQLDLSTCIVAVGLTTIVYTMFGGLRSVVWNDCVQFFIYTGGAAWAFVVLLARVPGGWQGLVEFGAAEGKFRWLFLGPGDAAEHGGISFALGLVGGAFLALATHGTDHLIVQRLLGSRSVRQARRAMVLSGIVVFLQFSFFLIIGVALAYFYQAVPLGRPEVASDEVLAIFIVDHLHVGVVGLVLASVFAAAMSTQSSSLNASAGAWISDFYRPLICPDASDERLLRAGKLATVVFGLLQVAVAIAAQEFAEQRNIIDLVLGIAAFAYGPILGLFFLAARRDAVPAAAALWGFSAGLAVLVLLRLLPEFNVGVPVNTLWFTAIGSLVTLAVGTVAARCRGPRDAP